MTEFSSLASIGLVTRTVTGQDADGNDVYGETVTEVSGIFAPGGSTEQVGGGDLVVTQPAAYLPAGTSVSAVDAVIVSGERFEVDGRPQVWPANPMSGWRPPFPVAVALRRVTG